MVGIRQLERGDFHDASTLWRTSPWASVSDTDSPEYLDRFIIRNPGCSWIAEDGEVLVGTILAGHDCRRGYIYHLVVAESHRDLGIGRELLDRALHALRQQGIIKCHAMVMNDNPAAAFFWTRLGWEAQGTTQYSRMLVE